MGNHAVISTAVVSFLSGMSLMAAYRRFMKRADQALGGQPEKEDFSSQKRLEIISRVTSDAIWDWNLKDNSVWWNHALETVLGYAPGRIELTGDAWIAHIHPEDRDRISRDIHAAIDHEATYWEGEYRFLKADGRYAFIFDRGHILRDTRGEAIRMIGSMLDNTDRVLASIALEESKDRLDLALKSSGIGTWVWRIGDESVSWDNSLHQLFGFAPGAFGGTYQRFLETLHPDDRDRVAADVSRSIKFNVDLDAEFRVIWPDGSAHHIGSRGRVYRDTEGRPLQMTGVCWDISHRKQYELDLQRLNESLELRVSERTNELLAKNTQLTHQVAERQKAETALRESLSQFKLLAESIPQQLWTVDADGCMDYLNPQALRYVDRRLEDMTPESRIKLIHPDDRARCCDRWLRSVETGGVYEIEFRILRGSDQTYRWHIGRALPFRDDLGRITRWFGTNTDIDDQKNAEAVIAKQRSAMVQSSKMSALGEMAGGVAHEINNPLAIIHARAGQLKEMAGGENLNADMVRVYSEKIEATARRISKIVSGLRSFARDGERDSFVVTPVSQIVEETVELCRERFRSHGVELRIAPIAATLTIECRAVQISQVLLNLLNNAHDAVENLDEKWISFEAGVVGQDVRIMVTDSGNGIDPAVRDKIMQPFFTTKEVGKGTGLGLSVSQGILESHHGSLRLDPDSLKTRFVVELPKSRKGPPWQSVG